MTNDKKFSSTLRIRIDPELLKQIKFESEKLNTDISTYVRWCIRTGLYLDYLNNFIRSEIKEEKDNYLKKKYEEKRH
jgi:hypothetical protein